MKAMMAVFALLITTSSAHAADKCGDTLREVIQIVNQQYPKVDAGEMAACFAGNWGYGLVITMDKPLNMGGYSFEACPKANGNIELRRKGSSSGGILDCDGGSMQAVRFSGELAMANGTWTKQSTTLASGRGTRK